MTQFDVLRKDLLEEIKQMPVVDAHEHLPPESERLQRQLDFFSLFEHYSKYDLIAAGMPPATLRMLTERTGSSAERWEAFKPYLSAARTTGYIRAALLVVRELLGLPDLDDSTYMEVSERLQAVNRPGHYDDILRRRCSIKALIQCWRFGIEGAQFPDYFFHLAPSPQLVDLPQKAKVEQVAMQAGVDITNLDTYLAAMEKIIAKWADHPQVVGIKSAHAYHRSLDFQRVDKTEAAGLFDRLMNEGKLPPAAYRRLQDFLMYELVSRAAAVHLPVAFHTGLQAGNYCDVRHSDPLPLQTLISNFPQARFDLFHGGMPWVREIAILAKHFPGVYLNMAWMHIISPTQSRSALSEWLDLVPNTKIFAFGGDYSIVEKVFGHLLMARENVADVLAEKVTRGEYTHDEALLVARRLFYDNPKEFYRLPID
ncbi:MAG TPA: amidohydrolase family protein [Firmicutes bacterium]|nr:amidohydrolase family protein [Bacillota bacterium]